MFEVVTLDDALQGPAYGQFVDWDGVGGLEVLVSSFGKPSGFGGLPGGSIALYTRAGGTWTRTLLVESSEDIKFPNDPSVVDVDGDGDLDLVVPYGFLACAAVPFGGPCGGIAWFERQGSGLVRHDVVPGGSALFYHRVHLLDVDGDGVRDMVTVGEEKVVSLFGNSQRAVPHWFKGSSTEPRFAAEARLLVASSVQALGSLPELVDMDDDGDLDLASAEFFVEGGGFAWLENPGAGGAEGGWTRHVMTSQAGPAIQLARIPNLYGPSMHGWMGTNHTNTGKTPPDPQQEGVYSLAPAGDPRSTWSSVLVSEGIRSRPGSPFAPMGAPGVFGWGDIDGDGDVDLAVSGDGDARVFWLEQVPGRQWVTHVLAESLGQAGGMKVADVGDGRTSILVTSYEEDKVLLLVRP